MNIKTFIETYAAFKDADKITITTCDDPRHEGEILPIGKQAARRNILKNGGEKFICRQCCMKYNNPFNHTGESRQTNEIIVVYCPCEEHKGEPSREMKKSCYFGPLEEPYLQLCGSCVQLGKEISPEQREKIRQALKGIQRSDEFKEKLRQYMKNNPEGIARGKANLIPGIGGVLRTGIPLPEEWKEAISESLLGKEKSEEHCQNISDGRKKMLEEAGGFTREHRENISKATIEQYRKGFEPKLHHLKGWHESPKAGRVYFRSSYEKKAYMKLDKDENVVMYYTEKLDIPYFHPVKQITSYYLIDLEIEYIDGSKKLVEIKPESWLDDEIVIAKIEAGKLKGIELGLSYEVWTEMDLFGHVYNKKNMQAFCDKIRNGEI